MVGAPCPSAHRALSPQSPPHTLGQQGEEPGLHLAAPCARGLCQQKTQKDTQKELRETGIFQFVRKVWALPMRGLSCPWWTGKWVFKALTLSSALFFSPSTFWMFSLGISGPLMELFFPVSHHKSCTFILVFGKNSKYSHELKHNLFSFVA